MAQTIADVMTPNPVTLSADASVVEAALVMRDNDIGDVIVCDDQTVCGIVTDRDRTRRSPLDVGVARPHVLTFERVVDTSPEAVATWQGDLAGVRSLTSRRR